jgi:hypothetical protein
MPVIRRVPITTHIRARKKEGLRQATRSSRSTMGRWIMGDGMGVVLPFRLG